MHCLACIHPTGNLILLYLPNVVALATMMDTVQGINLLDRVFQATAYFS